jgi:phospholipase C
MGSLTIRTIKSVGESLIAVKNAALVTNRLMLQRVHDKMKGFLPQNEEQEIQINNTDKQNFSSSSQEILPPIKHFVVLMLENQSFDRMLGFLKQDMPELEGLTGTENNPVNPADPSSPIVKVYPPTGKNIYVTADPGHLVPDVVEQVYGSRSPAPDAKPKMNGFISNFMRQPGVQEENAKRVMECLLPSQVPVLSTLAKNFLVCDHWFSSLSGPTWPNRFFFHAGTSDGHIETPGYDFKGELQTAKAAADKYDMNTIFNRFQEKGISWKIYQGDIGLTDLLSKVTPFKKNFYIYHRFLRDARRGALPTYSFIEPRYFDLPSPFNKNKHIIKANDQHPPHDVRDGEKLIAEVYNTLRNSPSWKNTLLMIVYDEHGGYYDHVPPPPAVNPDGKTHPDFPRAFDTFGLRVPAILISPWVKQGVDHTIYDHTSFIRTMEKKFNLEPLTKRDASANTFEHNFLPEPRNDTPKQIGFPKN